MEKQTYIFVIYEFNLNANNYKWIHLLIINLNENPKDMNIIK